MPSSPKHNNQKWVVGLDLRPRSHGAMALARWMHERGDDSARHQFRGIHVIEGGGPGRFSNGLDGLDGLDGLEKVVKAARDVVAASLQSHGVSTIVDPVDVVMGDSAEATLLSAAADPTTVGLILGRRAYSESVGLVRLGRVARRVVRNLPRPVIVTPPDLALESLGTGPIVVATDMGDASVGVARFAVELAGTLRRRLLIATCAGLSSAAGMNYLPPASWERMERTTRKEVRDRLTKWLAAQGLADVESRVLEGFTTPELIKLAKDEGSCMIACGSRQMTRFERIFSASSGLALAGSASLPVAIVPPDWAPG